MESFFLKEILLLTENVHSYLLKLVHRYLLKLVHCYLRKNVHCYLPFTFYLHSPKKASDYFIPLILISFDRYRFVFSLLT